VLTPEGFEHTHVNSEEIPLVSKCEGVAHGISYTSDKGSSATNNFAIIATD
jgi:hypothetical protein